MAEFIVAIELGSSKITGIAGKKNLDGSISVLAVVKEDATQCIRKGVVYNIDKTGQCLTSIINKLRKQLKYEISQVYVGVGGQSIRSVRNVIVKDLPTDTIITSDMINELMDANRNMTYPDQEILDAATQEYKVDNQYSLDPVGIKASRLEGNFLNILWRKAFYDNLNNSFEKSGISIAEMYLAPLALADAVLSEAEKRGGCVLVDFGADTTTVSVYYKNILRHLAVIPLGGNNITKDIASLQMEEKDAEAMKLKYGSAFTENNDIDNTLKYSIDAERSVDSRKFIEIILTGGGMNLKNIERCMRNTTHIDKIRKANFVTHTISSSNADITARNGNMNTILGLLAKGDMNCAGAEYNPAQTNLFNNEEIAVATPIEQPYTPSTAARQGQGIVPTPEEKKKAEAERRKREEEERKLREEEEARERELEEEKRRNSFWNKFTHKSKEFVKKIMAEEDDE